MRIGQVVRWVMRAELSRLAAAAILVRFITELALEAQGLAY